VETGAAVERRQEIRLVNEDEGGIGWIGENFGAGEEQRQGKRERRYKKRGAT